MKNLIWIPPFDKYVAGDVLCDTLSWDLQLLHILFFSWCPLSIL